MNRYLRAPWSPPEGSREAMIMDFMFKNGHTGYADEIMELHDKFYLTIGEAGPDWQHCEFTVELLDMIDNSIREIVQDADDRYEDWRTDPLP